MIIQKKDKSVIKSFNPCQMLINFHLFIYPGFSQYHVTSKVSCTNDNHCLAFQSTDEVSRHLSLVTGPSSSNVAYKLLNFHMKCTNTCHNNDSAP